MVDFSGYFKSYLDVLPILLIVISIYWTRIVGGPWVPSSMQVIYRMLDMAGVGPDDTVYDLGCGDGRILVAAAKRYHARAVGIGIDPIRYLWCQILISVLGLRKQVHIIFGNLFSMDLSEADVVVCYLMPDALSKLENKLKTELEPGKRIVSNKFSFPTLDLVTKDGNAILYTITPN
jgi:cyclopropane fatty-acyl-phospholipid synthase-like methyltransferase